MGKYTKLFEYLKFREEQKLRMSFDEIGHIVGGMPPSAYVHRPWWANTESHVQSKDGWLAAGWRIAHVDMYGQEATLIREPFMISDTQVECLCGCGGIPESGVFLPGHDQSLRVQIENSAGGIENLWLLIDNVQGYVHGEITETELAKHVRRILFRTKD